MVLNYVFLLAGLCLFFATHARLLIGQSLYLESTDFYTVTIPMYCIGFPLMTIGIITGIAGSMYSWRHAKPFDGAGAGEGDGEDSQASQYCDGEAVIVSDSQQV